MIKIFKNWDEIPLKFKGKLVILADLAKQYVRTVVGFDGERLLFNKEVNVEYIDGRIRIYTDD